MSATATAYGLTAERVVWSLLAGCSVVARGRRIQVSAGWGYDQRCIACADVPIRSVPAVVATWIRRLAAEAGPHV